MIVIRKTHIYTIRALKQTFRNWEAYIQIFILPVILLLSFAWLYGEGSGSDVGHEHGDLFMVGVINQDNLSSLLDEIPKFNSYLQDSNLIGNPLEEGFGDIFIKNINESSKLTSENETRQMKLINIDSIEKAAIAVQDRFLSFCFLIPCNFSQTLLAGINHKINLTNGYIVSNSSKLVFSEAKIELIGDFSYSRFSEAISLLEDQLRNFVNIFYGLEMPSKVILKYDQISSANFTEFHTFIPAFLIMTLLMSSAGITYILAFEREIGTIDRLKLCKFPKIDLILGLSFTQFITTSLQIIVFFITVLFIGFPGKADFILALIIALVSIIPVFGIGLFASVYLEGELAFYLPGLLSIPLSFLTGSFIPLPKIYLLGDIQIWHLNPFYSASEAIRKVLFLRYDLSHISLELILLLGISLPIFLLGALVFNKRIYKTENE